jgi:ferritin-like metal-binding protein YciE
LEDSTALDAGLIAAAQKVQRYENASYGTVCAWTEQMGHTDALALLEESLSEEKAANERLTEVALNFANEESEGKERKRPRRRRNNINR